MEYENIFELANNLINVLSFCDNDDLIYYIINEIYSNGNASVEGFKEYMTDKYC